MGYVHEIRIIEESLEKVLGQDTDDFVVGQSNISTGIYLPVAIRSISFVRSQNGGENVHFPPSENQLFSPHHAK